MCKSECSDQLRAQICILSLGGLQHCFFPKWPGCSLSRPPATRGECSFHIPLLCHRFGRKNLGPWRPAFQEEGQDCRPASLRDGKGKTSGCHMAGRAESGARRGPVGLLQTRALAPTPMEAGVRRLRTTRRSPAAFCLFG